MLKRYWFPLSLLAALLVALFVPQPGAFLESLGSGTPLTVLRLLVVVIFVLTGAAMAGAQPNKSLLKPLTWGLIVNALLPVPLLWVAAYLNLWPAHEHIAWVVFFVGPCTLSSGIVLASQAGADRLLSVLLTLFCIIVGVLMMPWWLLFLMGNEGAAIDLMPLIINICVLVIIPMIIGFSLRKYLQYSFLKTIPSWCVIITVWMVASAKQNEITALNIMILLRFLVTALALHVIFFGVAYVGNKLLHIKESHRAAVLFVASQKSLPVALSVWAIVDAPVAAIVIGVIAHNAQIFMDALLVERVKIKPSTIG